MRAIFSIMTVSLSSLFSSLAAANVPRGRSGGGFGFAIALIASFAIVGIVSITAAAVSIQRIRYRRAPSVFHAVMGGLAGLAAVAAGAWFLAQDLAPWGTVVAVSLVVLGVLSVALLVAAHTRARSGLAREM